MSGPSSTTRSGPSGCPSGTCFILSRFVGGFLAARDVRLRVERLFDVGTSRGARRLQLRGVARWRSLCDIATPLPSLHPSQSTPVLRLTNHTGTLPVIRNGVFMAEVVAALGGARGVEGLFECKRSHTEKEKFNGIERR
jgi:hypothetical protein